MPEVTLQRSIIDPLLRRMGMEHVVYTHGNTERGKDFLCVTKPNDFGVRSFCAIVVKNEKFSGNAAKTSNAVSALTQVRQCKELTAINPESHLKEKPQQVYLFTTFDIPDGVLGDAGELLQSLKSLDCHIIGPSRFVALLRAHMPDFYSQQAFDSKVISERLYEYANTHHESWAFNTSQMRLLSDFFVNLSMNPAGRCHNGSSKTPFSINTSPANPYFSAESRLIRSLYFLAASVTADVDVKKFLSVRSNDTTSARRASKKSVTRRVALSLAKAEKGRDYSVQFELASFLQQCLTVNGVPPDEQPDGAHVTQQLSRVSAVTQFVQNLPQAVVDKYFDCGDPEHRVTLENLCSIKSAHPDGLLCWQDDVYITGHAGAGKTSLVRAIVREASLGGKRVILFPCNRIRDPSTPLRDAICEFISSTAVVTKEEAATYLDQCELLVIDGIDESASLDSRIWADIRDISCQSKRLKSRLGVTLDLTPELADAVSQDREGWLLKRRLSEYETRCLFQIAHMEEANDWRNEIAELSASLPRFVMACREEVSPELPYPMAMVKIQPFSDQQIEQFVCGWFTKNLDMAKTLLEWFDGHPRIREICRSPIVCSIVAGLYENGVPLPETRTEVYEQRVELLLGRWRAGSGSVAGKKFTSRSKKRFLYSLALAMHIQRKRQFDDGFAFDVWKSAFGHEDRSKVSEIISQLLIHDNIIVREGLGYSMGHLSYQEFLAANAIVLMQKPRFFRGKIYDAWWRQVAVFYVGLIGDGSDLLKMMQDEWGMSISDESWLSEIVDEAEHTQGAAKAFVKDFSEFDDDEDSSEVDNDLEDFDEEEFYGEWDSDESK